MSLFVLDTNIVSLYQSGDPIVTQRILAHPMSQLAVTVISIEEHLTGWYTRLRRAKKRDQLAHVYKRLADTISLLSGFQILTFTESAIDRYEQLRAVHRVSEKTICASLRLSWKQEISL